MHISKDYELSSYPQYVNHLLPLIVTTSAYFSWIFVFTKRFTSGAIGYFWVYGCVCGSTVDPAATDNKLGLIVVY